MKHFYIWKYSIASHTELEIEYAPQTLVISPYTNEYEPTIIQLKDTILLTLRFCICQYLLITGCHQDKYHKYLTTQWFRDLLWVLSCNSNEILTFVLLKTTTNIVISSYIKNIVLASETEFLAY